MSDADPSERVFHFSTALFAPFLLRDGLIACSLECFVHSRPAVYCTTRADWDNGAMKAEWESVINPAAGRTQVPQLQGDLYRIEVEPTSAPLSWAQFVARGGLTPFGRYVIATGSGRYREEPHRWRVSFDPIPRRSWIAVARCTGGPNFDWETVDPSAQQELAAQAVGPCPDRRYSERTVEEQLHYLARLYHPDPYALARSLRAARRIEAHGARLAELEATIEASRGDAVRVGQALAEIRDGRLYTAAGCPSFRTYCASQWHLALSRATEVIAIAEASEDGR